MTSEDIESPDEPTRRIRFRIIHLLYAMALIGSALATFGVSGLLPAVVLCAVWGWVFASESRPRAFPAVLLFLSLSEPTALAAGLATAEFQALARG